MPAIADYTALRSSILKWLDNDESVVNTAECIGLAEARLNRVLDMPEMEEDVTLTASDAVALPDDLWSIRSVYLDTDPRTVLEEMTPAVLRGRYAFQTVGRPEAYAVIAGNMILGPSPDSAYDIRLIYKAALPSLSDSNPTNWLLTSHPDLYLVASCMIAEARGWNDNRAANFATWWDSLMDEVAASGIKKRYGAAPLRLRSSVRWGG